MPLFKLKIKKQQQQQKSQISDFLGKGEAVKRQVYVLGYFLLIWVTFHGFVPLLGLKIFGNPEQQVCIAYTFQLIWGMNPANKVQQETMFSWKYKL